MEGVGISFLAIVVVLGKKDKEICEHHRGIKIRAQAACWEFARLL